VLIARLELEPGAGPEVGLFDGGEFWPLSVESLSELLGYSLARIREICLEALQASPSTKTGKLLAPIDGLCEVWAAGVTYEISRTERMKESRAAASIYELVYEASRPELFFKATSWRVVGPDQPVSLRRDSDIDVPEPELAVVANSKGEVVGYCICDDVSSRSIEGENPLYLPQAKVWLGSCALGPAIRPCWELPEPTNLDVEMVIVRGGEVIWEGSTTTSRMRRSPEELVSWLFRENAFPGGVVLATGTGLVPEMPFSLENGDLVSISIEEIGTLSSPVVRGADALGEMASAVTY
jgi:2-dehydro-3-deoxy-D-arabinonate dehydratase